MIRAELRFYEVQDIVWANTPPLAPRRVTVSVDADNVDDWEALAILNAEEQLGGSIASADVNRVG